MIVVFEMPYVCVTYAFVANPFAFEDNDLVRSTKFTELTVYEFRVHEVQGRQKGGAGKVARI